MEKLVKYLPGQGIRPVVLAGNDGERRQTPDDFVEKGLPADLNVELVPTRGPTFFHSRFHALGPAAKRYNTYKWLSFPERCIYVPDHMVRWTRSGRKVAESFARTNNVRCVLTSSPRESTHLVGLHLRENSGVPWIADFRDLWTHKSQAYRPATPIHDRWIRKLERRIMATADHVIANTEENREIYIRDFGLSPDRVSTVPNGFDRSDVELSDVKPFPSKKFRIGHMGSLAKTSYPWREFLEAFAALASEVGKENVEFVHCGNHSRDVNEFVAQRNLGDVFNYAGSISHFDAMRLMAATDVQLVLLYDNEDSYTLAPQKLYNYMIVPGPILSIAPQNGAVARVTEETRCGVVVPPARGDNRLYDQLLKFYREWCDGSLACNPDVDAIENYSRAEQAGKIAKIMRTIAD